MSALPTRPPLRILRADEADAWTDGFAFLEAARSQAQRLQAERREALDAARREGYGQGRAEGLQEAAKVLARTRSEVDAYLAGLEPALADLALDIVRRLLGEWPADEALCRLTRVALNEFREGQALTLQVQPALVDALRQRLAEAGIVSLELVGDRSLAPGQARLSSAVASVELGIEAQLQVLREALLPQVAPEARA
ncbi:HrpE/YscL family type III secretion apparatus protein [Stutzerimonas nosocomialis]|uniref:type III secretion system stator protein SctL n=1 Tax=Stutzerimonas nosocomialis TaxID=1056496 RepID=UPI00110946AE|nr:type III secretion system stator protein SctL [Stutzerimonas nosocomialis]TLX56892.1 HrpE/YscL family type III secretion apparatus protein [Stutzerimonas nosocomialis]